MDYLKFQLKSYPGITWEEICDQMTVHEAKCFIIEGNLEAAEEFMEHVVSISEHRKKPEMLILLAQIYFLRKKMKKFNYYRNLARKYGQYIDEYEVAVEFRKKVDHCETKSLSFMSDVESPVIQ